MSDTYEIVRFRFQQGGEVIKTGLTLEEAQAHCRREDTHGEGWFDGYREAPKYAYHPSGDILVRRKPGFLEQSIQAFNHTRGKL